MRIVPIVEVMIACCPNSDSTASGETRSARSEQSWSCALLKSLSRTASTNASTLRLACCSTWSLPATTSRPKPKRPPAQHRTNATPPTASPIHRLRRLRSIGGAANGGATPGPGGGAVTGPEGGGAVTGPEGGGAVTGPEGGGAVIGPYGPPGVMGPYGPPGVMTAIVVGR